MRTLQEDSLPRIFEIQNTGDCLDDLRATVSDLRKDPLNPRVARYGSIIAWSICDWVFKEHGSRLNINKLGTLQEYVKHQCPELAYLQDLGNSLKHRDITRYTPILIEAYEHKGPFSQHFSREFDKSRLHIKLQDGRILDFEEVIQEALSFWED